MCQHLGRKFRLHPQVGEYLRVKVLKRPELLSKINENPELGENI